VEAVEGPIRLNLCLTKDHACTRQGWCPAHNVWARAQAALFQVLKDANISTLAENAAQTRRLGMVAVDEVRWN
jgi:DNA-binding IscR family transcriptional regulator